jgi:hypothetical protein
VRLASSNETAMTVSIVVSPFRVKSSRALREGLLLGAPELVLVEDPAVPEML